MWRIKQSWVEWADAGRDGALDVTVSLVMWGETGFRIRLLSQPLGLFGAK